ncbi:hypothetical protein JOD54_000337 [Actinokineospora baliensis]|nr:hypothetical protein [Actinokineospora baliensis]
MRFTRLVSEGGWQWKESGSTSNRKASNRPT